MSIVEPVRLLDEFRQRRRELLRMIGPGIIVTLAAFGIAFYFVEPPPPDTLVIATGAKGGRYYAFATRYAEAFAELGITLTLRETAGSVENFDLLLHDDVSLAIVQGGTAPADAYAAGSIEAIASLYLEPLWVFHRAGLKIAHLGDLKGRRVAVGKLNSGSFLLATQLLAMNGIHDGRDGTEFVKQSGLQAVESLDADQVDAAMFVVGPESPMLPQLLEDPRLVLMEFSRQHAYARRLPFLKAVVLEQGVVDFEKNLPQKSMRLIAPAANLVTTAAMHDAFIPLLLEVAMAQHRDGGLLADDGELPSQDHVSFPVNPAAHDYLVHGPSFFQKHLSFWVVSMIDRTKILIIPLLTLLIPLFKIAPPVYRWRIRSRIYRWYDVLRGIDQKLREENDDDSSDHAARLQAMSKELNTVHIPLSYMEEFYNLRLHIDLVNTELERQTDPQDAAQSVDSTSRKAE